MKKITNYVDNALVEYKCEVYRINNGVFDILTLPLRKSQYLVLNKRDYSKLGWIGLTRDFFMLNEWTETIPFNDKDPYDYTFSLKVNQYSSYVYKAKTHMIEYRVTLNTVSKCEVHNVHELQAFIVSNGHGEISDNLDEFIESPIRQYSNEEILHKISTIINGMQKSVEIELTKEDYYSNLSKFVNFDSLDRIEFIRQLEQTFNITIGSIKHYVIKYIVQFIKQSIREQNIIESCQKNSNQ